MRKIKWSLTLSLMAELASKWLICTNRMGRQRRSGLHRGKDWLFQARLISWLHSLLSDS